MISIQSCPFCGVVGYIMSQSGLRNQMETVYASNSVSHMLTGHVYSRAMRCDTALEGNV